MMLFLYVTRNAAVERNAAVIEILGNISFRYAETEDPSFCQEEHLVFLVKLGGEWFIADVETKYDWFVGMYQQKDYDIF